MTTPVILVGVVTIGADQITKALAHRHGECTPLNDTGAILCPTLNHELLLNIGSGGGAPAVVWSVIGLVVFIAWARLVSRFVSVAPIAIALVVSGVIGNLIDRLVIGAARDFIGIPWAVINVADIALAVGLTWIVAELLIGVARTTSSPPAAQTVARP